MKLTIISCLILLSCFANFYTDAQCPFPEHFRGNWYSIDQGQELNTVINPTDYINEVNKRSVCSNVSVLPNTTDVQGRFDAKILIYNPDARCYQCFEFYFRSVNVIQYKQTTCLTTPNNRPPPIDQACSPILPESDVLTMFNTAEDKVNCKYTWEGTYHFTYEVEYGGGGICDSPRSAVVACQEPGSQYSDNYFFYMYYGKCADVSTSSSQTIRFICLGTWTDKNDNTYSAIADNGKEVKRERYRCMLTRKDQQYEDNSRYYALSRWADCSSLKSPYDGPIRLKVVPAFMGTLGVGIDTNLLVVPSCNFPRNFTGTWFTTGEFDSHVVINATHIYFKTKKKKVPTENLS